jgi:hypothetical protein
MIFQLFVLKHLTKILCLFFLCFRPCSMPKHKLMPPVCSKRIHRRIHFIWFSNVFSQKILINCVSLFLMLFSMFRSESLAVNKRMKFWEEVTPVSQGVTLSQDPGMCDIQPLSPFAMEHFPHLLLSPGKITSSMAKYIIKFLSISMNKKALFVMSRNDLHFGVSRSHTTL